MRIENLYTSTKDEWDEIDSTSDIRLIFTRESGMNIGQSIGACRRVEVRRRRGSGPFFRRILELFFRYLT